MAISEHPPIGTIIICDFSAGFKQPEMVKRRPVVVISPKIASRAGLCTIVALSTTTPVPKIPYHCQLQIDPPLPDPWGSHSMWVKGDMVYAVAFHRLDLIRLGKDDRGKRIYRFHCLNHDQLREVRECLLRSIGLSVLTKHL
ncbi:MAG TPA: type II toxin-antitoxin system PemK/MazF family toxin [Beijerinckiaceae bacterium]|nr:type II toxin-antitoxin system PemK/MazF family toxin [Beijerinckiaceae bacterium]